MRADDQNPSEDVHSEDATGDGSRVLPVKKPFVEPKISQPVDVLEATTYFQAVDSGGTLLLGRRPREEEL